MILDENFFNRDSLIVGKELLGKELNFIDKRGMRFSGIINEVEAYRGRDDEASHAFRGKTERNKVMFETFGHVYIYFIYGMHNCINFTTGDIGEAGGVLIRSVIPTRGIGQMIKNRGISDIRNLTNGPGKLCQAFGIGKELYGRKLCLEDDIYIEDIGYEMKEDMKEGKRIGIKVGAEKMWRFWF